MKDVLHQINEVIHQKVRLGIMTILVSRESAEFNELKQELELSDGNLSSHISLLEKNEFILIQKSFAGKRPQTTLKISKKGRVALNQYLDILRKIISP